VSKKIAFIVNPNSANGATGKEWPEIRKMAKDQLGSFVEHLTERHGDAAFLAKKAIAEGAEVIVYVGGDGTLNEVVNGLMSDDFPKRRDILLGSIPRGTGCDFIKSSGLRKDTGEALDIIKAGKSRSIDVGRFSYLDHNGNNSNRHFVNITSFGLGGEVDDRVNRTTKVFGGFISFIWATLVSIFFYEKKRIQLKIDDHFNQEVLCWNVAIANGRYHGGGMLVAPDAELDDGLFHVTIIGDFSLAGVFWNLPILYNGRILEHEKITALKGKHIEATSSQPVLLDVDGEQPGRLPIVIDIVPSALNLICG
jgi:YegS/Rv2252/BmrU family lipid kinase